MQKTQQRQRPRKQLQGSYRTIEISVMSDLADCLRIGGAKPAAYFSINVPQHRVNAKGSHARTVHRFHGGLKSAHHHGFGGMPVRRTYALLEAVVERVIQIKDHAADERFLYTQACRFEGWGRKHEHYCNDHPILLVVYQRSSA